MTTGHFVSYLRVSTGKQGVSGLGIEAQRHAVTAHVGSGDLVSEYVEVESGKKSDRPQLALALAHCRKIGAVLLIAKLDRLSRNVAFIANLMETKIPFVACDMPNATPFMLHVYAAVGEEEARAIGHRTKVALAAAKSRGVKLGGFRAEAYTAKRVAADRHAQTVRDAFQEASQAGCGSLRAIAAHLNASGHTTVTGAVWTATAVSRVQSRLTA